MLTQKLTVMKKIFSFFLLTVFCLTGAAQQKGKPIIDMHLHAQEVIWMKNLILMPPSRKGPETKIKDISELLPQTVEVMKANNIVLGVLSEENHEELFRWKEYDSRFLLGAMVREPKNVNLSNIVKDLESGKLEIMGEIASQYRGYAIDDAALEAFYTVAEMYDVPVLVHCAGIGGGVNFPITKGNPLLASNVMKRHPKLRLYIENAGYPFLEEIISLMYCYPKVYVDLSTITWVIPRKAFHKYLQGLIDAGLGKRLMFGSDQMIWPETIPMAIEAIESAEFLTEDQKRDIFYNNAARFLRLDEETIAKHHEK